MRSIFVLNKMKRLGRKRKILTTHMKIKRIEFMEDVRDVSNDNIDVLVEKEDGFSYIVTVGTPQDLLEEIVKKLTKEIIREAIQAYGEDDEYWLKLHHFSDELFED